MGKRQPVAPKGPTPEGTPPFEEENLIICWGNDHLTPEQKTWPVVRLKGQRPLHELVPPHRLPPGYTHPDFRPAAETDGRPAEQLRRLRMTDPPIQARHLLVCREVVYNPLDTEAPYSLQGVLHFIRPDADYGYPLCVETMSLYAQLFGEPGKYMVRIEVARLAEDGSEFEPPVVVRGPTPARVRPGFFVDGAQYTLAQVQFPAAGVYEFRLMLDGFNEPLAAERILLLEV